MTHKLQHFDWMPFDESDNDERLMTTYRVVEEIVMQTDNLSEIMQKCNDLIMGKGWDKVSVRGLWYRFEVNYDSITANSFEWKKK